MSVGRDDRRVPLFRTQNKITREREWRSSKHRGVRTARPAVVSCWLMQSQQLLSNLRLMFVAGTAVLKGQLV